MIKRTKIEFDINCFEEFFLEWKTSYNTIEKLGEIYNKNFLKIEYNQLRSKKGLNEILLFLNVDLSQELESSTQKRNNDNILSRFSNPEVVSNYLQEKGLQEWEFEQPKSLD